MHEIYLVKVPETVDLLTQTAPIAIMTRSPQKKSKTILSFFIFATFKQSITDYPFYC